MVVAWKQIGLLVSVLWQGAAFKAQYLSSLATVSMDGTRPATEIEPKAAAEEIKDAGAPGAPEGDPRGMGSVRLLARRQCLCNLCLSHRYQR